MLKYAFFQILIMAADTRTKNIINLVSMFLLHYTIVNNNTLYWLNMIVTRFSAGQCGYQWCWPCLSCPVTTFPEQVAIFPLSSDSSREPSSKWRWTMMNTITCPWRWRISWWVEGIVSRGHVACFDVLLFQIGWTFNDYTKIIQRYSEICRYFNL